MEAIICATKTGVIGKDNKLPWHYPDELNHFKQTILGKTIVVGRKTKDSLPKSVLKDREVITISRAYNPILPCNSIIIGGAYVIDKIYRRYINTMYLTILNKDYEGDTKIDIDYWMSFPKEVIKQTEDFKVYKIKIS